MAFFAQFDDKHLRGRALRAFIKSIHTDRMVAMTGAFATRALGYPSWKQFLSAAALIAHELVDEVDRSRKAEGCGDPGASGRILKNIKEQAERIIKEVGSKDKSYIDARVSIWALSEYFAALDRTMKAYGEGLLLSGRYQGQLLPEYERRVAAIFLSRTNFSAGGPHSASIRHIIKSLGIKRIVTLNYDLELERSFMLRGDEAAILRARDNDISQIKWLRAHFQNLSLRLHGIAPTADSAIAEFAASYKVMNDPSRPGELASVAAFVGEEDSGKPIKLRRYDRWSRTMSDGLKVKSDIVNRERPDRLFEFAVGSAEIHRHILHLHGRADVPKSMVANIRQYDRLYRLDDLYRDPLDHGLRMLFGGNPVVFLGLGMEEQEINDTLQYFVGNVPVRRSAPLFLIWNRSSSDTNDGAWNDKKRNMRLDFRARLGVYVLFDDNIAGELLPAPTSAKKDLAALPASLAKLPELASRVDKRAERLGDAWRSVKVRFDLEPDGGAPKEAHRMWGADALKSFADTTRTEAAPVIADLTIKHQAAASPITVVIADNGYGRGRLGEWLVGDTSLSAFPFGGATSPDPEDHLLINAGFAYDSDTMMAGIARFLHPRCPSHSAQDFDASVAVNRETMFRGLANQAISSTLIVINGADRFFGSDGAPISAEFDLWLRCVRAGGGSLRVVLLGNHRLRPYSRMLGIEPIRPTQTDCEQEGGGSRYLTWIEEKFASRQAFVWDEKMRDPDFAAQTEAKLLQAKTELAVAEAARAQMRQTKRIDSDAYPRTFFEAHLSPLLLRSLGTDCSTTFEILRTMCFIGAPVEGSILLYAPKVMRNLREDLTAASPSSRKRDYDRARQKLAKALLGLESLGLLLVLDPHQPDKRTIAEKAYFQDWKSGEGDFAGEPPKGDFPDQHDIFKPESAIDAKTDRLIDAILWRRYALHRALATFLRDRHGAPINDAKLATAFNLSMFMSDASGGTPEPDFHDELSDLVDHLVGAWHDITPFYRNSVGDVSKELKKWVQTRYSRAADQPPPYMPLVPDDVQTDESIIRPVVQAYRDASVCLRAALSIVRGYYSTSALLKIEGDMRASREARVGVLTEHADRLDRLINTFGDVAAARSFVRQGASLHGPFNNGVRFLEEIVGFDCQGFMGPEPFYADDLVWLWNERAMVALAQGDLFSARDALANARKLNDDHVEKGAHGRNWRRIAINRAAIRIERGALKSAERTLSEIEFDIESFAWPDRKPAKEKRGRLEAIRKRLVDFDKTIGEHDQSWRGDKRFSREECFIVAMVTGYRGLIANLRGDFSRAKADYDVAIPMLRVLGEHRAAAHFQRHYARLLSFFRDRPEALIQIEYAITTAQGARQMDILHRCRIVRADLWMAREAPPERRKMALQEIKEALDYAVLADCYRLRVEACASLARHMRNGGDYDTALRYAADAMTIAARNGHSLQKTTLRIELSRILEMRGDPISGQALLDKAIEIGTAKGFNEALERIRKRPANAAYGYDVRPVVRL